MKNLNKISVAVLSFIFCTLSVKAQQDIRITFSSTTGTANISASSQSFDLNNGNENDYTITVVGADANDVINAEYTNTKKLNTTLTSKANRVYNIPKSELQALSDQSMDLNVSFSVTNNVNQGRTFSPNPFKAKIKIIPKKKPPMGIEKSRQDVINELKAHRTFSNPYESKRDLVHLYFDVNGKLLNNLPVNVDQNDRFVFYIVCQVGYQNEYSVKVVEGNYAPSDLSIRPYTPIADGINAIQNASTGEIPLAYTYTTIRKGPFTSENFEFQIAFDDTLKKIITHSEPYSIKINKLYHVGVGVSLIHTSLNNPDFRIAPLGAGNTIETFNSGSRMLTTFNVIWYWSVLQQKRTGNDITSGRDILKDEPTFSFRRIYPTIGVSLDNNFRENYFVGAVYEFARGGSLIAGVHYGKVKELSDKSFIVGSSAFTGSNDDIRLTNVYRPAFFFGINIDTRILNTLFSRGN